MDNPEKLTPLGTQDTGRKQTKQNTENSKHEQHGHTKKLGVNTGAHEE